MLTKTKLASLVAQQFPEFIRDDYQKFVDFIEAYYDFVEQNYNTDVFAVRDIDTTLDAFVKYFKKELIGLFPNTNVDERFLIANIRDAYLAKGSESSYRLLMRLLFDKEVGIYYPSKQMLRASSGKWIQQYSIFVKVTRGDPFSLVGKTVKIKTIDKIIDVTVSKVVQVEVEENGIKSVSPDLAEIFVDRRFFGSFSANDKLYYSNTFESYVVNTTSKVSVSQSGEGFRVGDVYELRNGTGTNSKIKIDKVDANGGIVRASLISYGAGYDAPFSMSLVSNKTRQENINTPEFSFSYPLVGLTEYYTGLIDQGEVVSSTYNIDPIDVAPAIPSSYVGDLLAQFYNSNQQSIISPTAPAVIKVDVGSVAKYPGYWDGDDGFLDSSMFIQDSYYYQAYSYVLKIDEQLEKYKSAVKTLVHPAGMALFGEYEITNEFDIGSSLQTMIEILYIMLQDMAVMQDSGNIKDIIKEVRYSLLNDGVTEDNNDVLVTNYNTQNYFDSTYLVVTEGSGLYVSSYTELDYITKDIGKLLEDSFATSHLRSDYAVSDYTLSGYFSVTSGNDAYVLTPVLLYTGNEYVEYGYLAVESGVDSYVSESIDLSQSLIFDIEKSITEEVPIVDNIVSTSISKGFTESVTLAGNYGDNSYVDSSYFTLNTGITAYVVDLLYNETEFDFGKSLVDSFTMVELPQVVLSRGVTDAFSLTDGGSTTTFEKNLSDFVFTLDYAQVYEANTIAPSETAFTSDNKQFSLTRQLSDNVTITDEITVSASKQQQLSDEFTVSESIQINEFNVVGVQETPIVDDSSVFSLTRSTSDTVSTTGVYGDNSYSESTYFVTSSGLDSYVVDYQYDEVVFSVDKQQTELLTITEDQSFTLSRDTADSLSLGDNQVTVLNKSFSDSATINDQISITSSVFYELSDNVTPSDVLQLAEDNSVSTSDPATVSDASSNQLTKYISETVSTTQSGYIWLNAYGDMSYFAHDNGYYMDNTTTL